VTANVAGALERGIEAERIFPFWDWVGGRYSVWSSVGLGAALAVGNDAFEGLLEGARQMDAHFHTAPLEANMPVILALLSVWNVNFLGAKSHAILPYSDRLRAFPDYLQQLEMESNGKRVDRDGKPVDYDTAPVIWGSTGTVSQHSFHQLLHQGTMFVPVDFIVPRRGEGDAEAHALLVANALAQGSALMLGTPPGRPHFALAHAVCPGNRPSSTLLLERLSPAALGQLVALYEHKVFVQGVLWNINSFDQWGVELGKKIAQSLAAGPQAKDAGFSIDPSTAALLERVRS
jgi:glucose-6-phosphate isomerase